ncbi:hypothetical protein QJS10_CPB18g01394 [Acorus calamus]|uniref:MYB-CC type transcription factor LHEQLE-containing domain-containing protein n=1 Tax=Acorus calamus TaxID=4465 RepID=A0AAV9CMB9_ACOCL|nr:hypothetical protein QJS10_CPB18g01394 [Acorus calamus]
MGSHDDQTSLIHGRGWSYRLMLSQGLSGLDSFINASLTRFLILAVQRKYRLGMDRNPETSRNDRNEEIVNMECRNTRNTCLNSDSTQIQINESVLQMQMEVQKKLQEQIEVQRHLQLRIEAQGRYLQSVLKKAHETLTGYNSNSVGVESAKAELSKLASSVDVECMGSSFSGLTEPSTLSARKQAKRPMGGSADCSTDSCLTSPGSSWKEMMGA